MAQEGSTPFLKPLDDDVVATTGPVDEAYLACLAFTHKTRHTLPRVIRTSIRSFDKLLNTLANELAFEERLTILQAVLLFQIMAYFGGEKDLCEAAEQCSRRIDDAIELLERDLHGYGSSFLTSSVLKHRSEYQHWLLLESARRTILAHLFIKAIFYHIRHGYCDLVPRLAVLPLTVEGDLWNTISEDDWHDRRRSKHSAPTIKTYLEALDSWTANDQHNMDDFGIMLMGACKDVKG